MCGTIEAFEVIERFGVRFDGKHFDRLAAAGHFQIILPGGGERTSAFAESAMPVKPGPAV